MNKDEYIVGVEESYRDVPIYKINGIFRVGLTYQEKYTVYRIFVDTSYNGRYIDFVTLDAAKAAIDQTYEEYEKNKEINEIRM